MEKPLTRDEILQRYKRAPFVVTDEKGNHYNGKLLLSYDPETGSATRMAMLGDEFIAWMNFEEWLASVYPSDPVKTFTVETSGGGEYWLYDFGTTPSEETDKRGEWFTEKFNEWKKYMGPIQMKVVSERPLQEAPPVEPSPIKKNLFQRISLTLSLEDHKKGKRVIEVEIDPKEFKADWTGPLLDRSVTFGGKVLAQSVEDFNENGLVKESIAANPTEFALALLRAHRVGHVMEARDSLNSPFGPSFGYWDKTENRLIYLPRHCASKGFLGKDLREKLMLHDGQYLYPILNSFLDRVEWEKRFFGGSQ